MAKASPSHGPPWRAPRHMCGGTRRVHVVATVRGRVCVATSLAAEARVTRTVRDRIHTRRPVGTVGGTRGGRHGGCRRQRLCGCWRRRHGDEGRFGGGRQARRGAHPLRRRGDRNAVLAPRTDSMTPWVRTHRHRS